MRNRNDLMKHDISILSLLATVIISVKKVDSEILNNIFSSLKCAESKRTAETMLVLTKNRKQKNKPSATNKKLAQHYINWAKQNRLAVGAVQRERHWASGVMIKLTGSEFKKLWYIGRYPSTRHSQKLTTSLDGEAKEIALILIGKKKKNNPERDPHREQVAKQFRRG